MGYNTYGAKPENTKQMYKTKYFALLEQEIIVDFSNKCADLS